MHWYLEVFRKGLNFSGRARRREYWMFTLVNFLISLGLVILHWLTADQLGNSPVALVSFAYMLITLLPTLAVTVRRLHDSNESGWMMFINVVPLLGGIIFLILMVARGTPGDNRYGPDPKRELGVESARPALTPAA